MSFHASATTYAAVFPSENAGSTFKPSLSPTWKEVVLAKGGESIGIGFPRSVTQSETGIPAMLPSALASSRRFCRAKSRGAEDEFAESQASKPTAGHHNKWATLIET